MMDLDEYERRKPNGKSRGAYQYDVLQRAAVEAKHLTGTQHWDYFLSLLQPKVQETRALLEDTKELLADPVVSDEKIRQLRFAAAIYRERLAVLEGVMDLPRDIIEKGEKAELHEHT